MKDRNSEGESFGVEEEQRRRRSGSVMSYCTKYIFGAYYGKHIRSCACCGNCRKFTMTGEVCSGRRRHEEGVVSLSGRKVKGVMGSFFQMSMSMFAHACV